MFDPDGDDFIKPARESQGAEELEGEELPSSWRSPGSLRRASESLQTLKAGLPTLPRDSTPAANPLAEPSSSVVVGPSAELREIPELPELNELAALLQSERSSQAAAFLTSSGSAEKSVAELAPATLPATQISEALSPPSQANDAGAPSESEARSGENPAGEMAVPAIAELERAAAPISAQEETAPEVLEARPESEEASRVPEVERSEAQVDVESAEKSEENGESGAHEEGPVVLAASPAPDLVTLEESPSSGSEASAALADASPEASLEEPACSLALPALEAEGPSLDSAEAKGEVAPTEPVEPTAIGAIEELEAVEELAELDALAAQLEIPVPEAPAIGAEGARAEGSETKSSELSQGPVSEALRSEDEVQVPPQQPLEDQVLTAPAAVESALDAERLAPLPAPDGEEPSAESASAASFEQASVVAWGGPGVIPVPDAVAELPELLEINALASQLREAEGGPDPVALSVPADPEAPKRPRVATLRYKLSEEEPESQPAPAGPDPAPSSGHRKKRKGGTRVDLVALGQGSAPLIPAPEPAPRRTSSSALRREPEPRPAPLVFGSAGVSPPVLPPPRRANWTELAFLVESVRSAERDAETKKSQWTSLVWVVLTLIALAPISVLLWLEWSEARAQSHRAELERASSAEDWESALRAAEALLAIEPDSGLRRSQVREFRRKLELSQGMTLAKAELEKPAASAAARVQQGQRAFELAPSWAPAARAWLSALEESATVARARGELEAEQSALRRALEAIQVVRSRSIPGLELDLLSARLRLRVRAEDEGLHETQLSRDLENAARGDPNAAEPVLARALIAERRADYRSALQLYQAGLVRDPKARWALLRRAEVLRRERSSAAAREDLRRALELQKDYEGLCLRGHLRLDEGELEAAGEDLAEALALAPGCVRAAALRFRLEPLELRAESKLETTVAELKRLAEVDPLDPWPLLVLAELWIVGASQDPEEALRCLGQAIKLDPNLAEAHYWRGRAEQMLDSRAEAMSAYDRCLVLDPRNPYALANRAMLHRQSGQHDRAISDVEAAGRLAPNDSRVSFQRAKVHWEVLSVDRVPWSDPQWDRVVDLLQLACKQDPSAADVYGRLAYLYERRGRSNEALANYDKAVNCAGSNGYWAGIRGLYLTRIKRYREALEDFKAFEKNPSSASNSALYGRISEAREYCQRELEKGSGE